MKQVYTMKLHQCCNNSVDKVSSRKGKKTVHNKESETVTNIVAKYCMHIKIHNTE